MKKNFKKIFIGTAIFSTSFLSALGVNALTITESVSGDTYDKIVDGTVVMGITKFKPGTTITAKRASDATMNDMIFKYAPGSNYSGVEIHYFLSGEWFNLDENNKATPIDDEKKLEKINTADIYYVNNKEKMLEVSFTNKLEEGYEFVFKADNSVKSDDIIVEDGKLLIPATVQSLDVYVKNTETKTEEKLDNFVKSAENNAEFKQTQSSQGTIEKGDSTGGKLTYETTNNTIKIKGNITWYGADANAQNGRIAGNYASVKISAPNIYDEEYLKANATIKFDNRDAISWSQVIDSNLNENTFFGFYPRFDKDTKTHTIVIKWSEGNTQTFVIDASEALLEDAPQGLLTTANSSSKNAVGTITADDIVFTGTLSHYNALDSQNGRSAGNYVDVKFTAPKGYTVDYLKANATVKIDDREAVSWETVIDSSIGEDTYFVYYPRFDKDTKAHTVVITWEKGNTQTFTIDAKDAALEGAPQGTLTTANTSSPSAEGVVTDNNVVFTGTLKYYNALDSQNGRSAGNYVDVKFTAPKGYTVDYLKANATVKIDDREAVSWETVIDSSIGEDTYFVYYPRFDKDTKAHTVVITWEKGNTQTFTIDASNTSLEAAPQGTVATANTSSKNAVGTITDNKVAFTGELSYYQALGSQNGRKTGWYTDVTITAPTKYDKEFLLANATVKVDDRNAITWNNIIYGDETTSFTYYPRFDEKTKSHTVVITWEEGNTQTFTIDASEALLEAIPQGSLTTANSSSKNAVGTITDNKVAFTGELSYYQALDSQNGRIPGWYTDVTISAPKGYTVEYLKANATVKVDGRDAITWDKVIYGDETTSFTYYPRFDETTKSHTVVITWEEGNTQTFVIDASGVSLEAIPQGTLTTANSSSTKAVGTITGNNVVFNGEISYYPALDSQNGRKAGWYTDVTITAPEGYTVDYLKANATVKIDKRTVINWSDIIYGDETTSFTYYPRFDEDTTSHTIIITWEKGNTQTFTINLSESTTLENAIN